VLERNLQGLPAIQVESRRKHATAETARLNSPGPGVNLKNELNG